MPLQIPIGYASAAIRIKGALDPEPWVVTHGIETTLDTHSALEHANGVMAAYVAGFGAATQNTSVIQGVTLTIGTDAPDPVIVESTNTPVTGGTSGAMLPQNCALLVKKQTGLGGRRNRGRSFIPSVLREAQVDQYGGIESLELTGLQTAATAWLSALNTSSGSGDPVMPMVILHNYPDGLPGALEPTPVASLVVDPRIATQRRRLRR